MYISGERYLQTHCGTSPLHFPFSSQVDKGSPTTLYPLSHLYFARAPILYEVAPVFEFSAVPVRINVLPYIRSFPVTERIPCSASTGSGQRISETRSMINMIQTRARKNIEANFYDVSSPRLCNSEFYSIWSQFNYLRISE